MAIQSGTSLRLLPEYQEEYLKDLLASASALGQEGGQYVPEYEVAGLTPLQQQAVQYGSQGIGSYAPFFQAASQAVGEGLGATRASQMGFDPSSYQAYMDPYQQEVIDQQYQDIQRLGDQQQQALKDQAVRAGAFGGGRQAIGEAEIGRNVLQQQARTGAQLRSTGFQSAMGQAQRAFENQMARQQSAAQIFGGLGQAQMGLGTGIQGAQSRDVSGLMGLGSLEQAQRQAELDAFRKTQTERERAPYQNIGFLSDVFRGVPSMGGTYTQQQTPDPSMISQVAGLGLGLAGLGQAYPNLFGGRA
tara:strand:- start:2241 stop:3149 length:909 start_codon:yes stop_codon:yes gene_type:complete